MCVEGIRKLVPRCDKCANRRGGCTRKCLSIYTKILNEEIFSKCIRLVVISKRSSLCLNVSEKVENTSKEATMLQRTNGITSVKSNVVT